MELDNIEIIGKVLNQNSGKDFKNVAVVSLDKMYNIKTTSFQDQPIPGLVYKFDCIKSYKEEKTIYTATHYQAISEVYSNRDLAEIYSKFYSTDTLDLKEILKDVYDYIDKIENKIIRDITRHIYDNNIAEILVGQAGKTMHHAYIGGLVFHTISMIKTAINLKSVYPTLSDDLLIGGILLHDAAKIYELEVFKGEYTNYGTLLGHLTMGVNSIAVAAKELGYENSEEVMVLEHIVLSHHGIANYGSIKKPMIAEALVIWYLDTLDSKISEVINELKITIPGDFTNSVSAADKMRFYKPKFLK
jgi:3'-5' exoribonuclease